MMSGMEAKAEMVNRYLNMLLKERGEVNPCDVFRAVSPEMRKHFDIVVLDAEYTGNELEFVKARERHHDYS